MPPVICRSCWLAFKQRLRPLHQQSGRLASLNCTYQIEYFLLSRILLWRSGEKFWGTRFAFKTLFCTTAQSKNIDSLFSDNWPTTAYRPASTDKKISIYILTMDIQPNQKSLAFRSLSLWNGLIRSERAPYRAIRSQKTYTESREWPYSGRKKIWVIVTRNFFCVHFSYHTSEATLEVRN